MLKADYKAIGKRMQEIREEYNMTEQEMADELSITVNMLAKIECGLRKPSLEILCMFADKFNQNIDYLVFGKTSQEN